ncbi:hypothetical protein [Microcystis sp. BLCC-F209]|uniref:hypothetical protein n=1 Tax=Microcystis sp. BLCC-F209 TaxID=3342750 RepID=UPI0035B7A411
MAPPAVNKARPIPIIQGKEILSLERELGIIQLSVISYQLSVISYQLSVISYQLSVISYQLSVISRTLLFSPRNAHEVVSLLPHHPTS